MKMAFGSAAIATAVLATAVPFGDVYAQAGDFHGDPELTEWMVPYEESRPRDPFVAPDGRVWFVGQRSHYVGVLNPETGDFMKYDLDDGTGPHNVIVDQSGVPWYSGNASRSRHIGRVDPATGQVEKFMIPEEGAYDPHTLVWAKDGTIWFTVQQGNYVGHFDPESGEYRLAEMPQAQGRRGMGSSRPYGIKMDSQDRPWIALFNTNAIATVDPETFATEVHRLPSEDARPRRLVVDSKDDVWYVDYSLGRLGKLETETGEVREWPMPGGDGARPYGVAIDAADRVWFVETGLEPNYFVGFDPETEEFFSRVPIESGGGTVRHMHYDRETNTVWFGADTNTIGRAVLPPLRRITSQ